MATMKMNFLFFFYLLISCRGNSQVVLEKFNGADAVELISNSTTMDDATILGTMRFVFFKDYIFMYSKLIKEKKNINSRTGEITAQESYEGVSVKINHKDSNIEYFIEDELRGEPKKYSESPSSKGYIINYLLVDALKGNDNLMNDKGDTIFLTETIKSSIAPNMLLKYTTAIKKVNKGDDIQKYLFSEMEKKYGGRIVQCIIMNPENETQASKFNFTYSKISNVRKANLLRLISEIEKIEQIE